MNQDSGIHAGGNNDFVTELKKQRNSKISDISNDDKFSEKRRKSLIAEVIEKFDKLIGGSQKNLYFGK